MATILTSCTARWPPQYAPAPAERRPISGQFVVRGQELPTAYVRAKFEDRSFIRLRNIGTFRCTALIDPVTLTFDLEIGVGVACDLGYPCAKFRIPRPFGFRVRADVRDIRQTDDGRRSPLNAPPPTGRGHNNFPENQLTKFRAFRASGRESVSIDDKRVPRGDWRDTRLWRYVA